MNANKQDAGGLPELPEPAVKSFKPATHDTAGHVIYTFSTDQMRAYGEQCRAASGVEEVARQMEAMAEHIQASSPEQKAERLRGWASMLRALSRGVPEGK